MNFMKIESSSLSNGEGWRVVLWCAGCSHACKNCHNPETWAENAGHPFTKNEVDLIVELLKPDYIHGITLSGGDPLFIHNRETMTDLCRYLKEIMPNKTIWCYTGYEYDAVKDLPIMDYIDVLIDGKYVEKERDVSLAFRGSRNQRIIDVAKSKQAGDVVLWSEK